MDKTNHVTRMYRMHYYIILFINTICNKCSSLNYNNIEYIIGGQVDEL